MRIKPSVPRSKNKRSSGKKRDDDAMPLEADRSGEMNGESDKPAAGKVAFGENAIAKLTDRQLIEAVLNELVSLKRAMDM